MRRLKIGIRPQLIVLVCFASLFSLLILGIVTGLYFSENLTQLRSERLYVISQLKSTQVEQALSFIAYQVGTLSAIDAITTPLSQYRAGNNSNAVFTSAQNTLDQFMSSTKTLLPLDYTTWTYRCWPVHTTMQQLFPNTRLTTCFHWHKIVPSHQRY